MGDPGAGCSYGHQDLLVGEVEGHGQLAEPRQPGQGRGDQLPRDAVHAEDEQPLGEAAQEVEHRHHPHYRLPLLRLLPEKSARVDNIDQYSWKYKRKTSSIVFHE